MEERSFIGKWHLSSSLKNGYDFNKWRYFDGVIGRKLGGEKGRSGSQERTHGEDQRQRRDTPSALFG